MATVEGATIEPGLRAALRSELSRSLARWGASGRGDGIEVSVERGGHTVEATAPAEGRATVWTADLVVSVAVPSRPGCQVEVVGRRSWQTATAGAVDVIDAREEAVRGLAQELANRSVEALLGERACRMAR